MQEETGVPREMMPRRMCLLRNQNRAGLRWEAGERMRGAGSVGDDAE